MSVLFCRGCVLTHPLKLVNGGHKRASIEYVSPTVVLGYTTYNKPVLGGDGNGDGGGGSIVKNAHIFSL